MHYIKQVWHELSRRVDLCGLAVLVVLFAAGLLDSFGIVTGTSAGYIAGIACLVVIGFAIAHDNKINKL